MGQVRIVIFIQVLNSFVAGVLGVALPLMMRERNVDIITIGLVFASLPIARAHKSIYTQATPEIKTIFLSGISAIIHVSQIISTFPYHKFFQRRMKVDRAFLQVVYYFDKKLCSVN